MNIPLRLFLGTLTALIIASCEKPTFDDIPSGNCLIDFSVTSADRTRSIVSIGDCFSRLNVQLFDADGQKVLDKVRTQNKDDADYGAVSLSLTPGVYTVVAVGHSSAVSATIKSPEMVQFTALDGRKLTDTFCFCGSITVGDSPEHHDLTLHRVTAMLQFRLTDTEFPSEFSRLRVDYTGGSANFNPTTFQGTTKSSQSELCDVSTVYQVFTFPYLSDSGLLKVTLSALSSDGAVLQQRAITDVPVRRNRITTYTGRLFYDSEWTVTETAFGFTVNADWDGIDYYNF